MKDYSGKFEVEGKEYDIVFNLNVMEIIQEEYKTIENWGKLTDLKGQTEVNAKALIFGLTAMINEGTEIKNEEQGTNEPLLTHKQVGRLVTKLGLEKSSKQLNEIIVESVKNDTKNE